MRLTSSKPKSKSISILKIKPKMLLKIWTWEMLKKLPKMSMKWSQVSMIPTDLEEREELMTNWPNFILRIETIILMDIKEKTSEM